MAGLLLSLQLLIITMPEKLKKMFEIEYKKKGKTKKEADRIFYGYQAKHKLKSSY